MIVTIVVGDAVAEALLVQHRQELLQFAELQRETGINYDLNAMDRDELYGVLRFLRRRKTQQMEKLG
jgi:hypothetical protein